MTSIYQIQIGILIIKKKRTSSWAKSMRFLVWVRKDAPFNCFFSKTFSRLIRASNKTLILIRLAFASFEKNKTRESHLRIYGMKFTTKKFAVYYLCWFEAKLGFRFFFWPLGWSDFTNHLTKVKITRLFSNDLLAESKFVFNMTYLWSLNSM